MNKKFNNRREHNGRLVSENINTSMADSLSGFSFKPLPLKTQRETPDLPKTEEPRRAGDGQTPHHHNRPAEKAPRVSHVVSSINTGLADAFKVINISDRKKSAPRKIPAPSQTDPVISTVVFDPEKKDRSIAPASKTPEKRLPNSRLTLLSQHPESEHTDNFAFVKYQDRHYTYPIHSWVPVMDLCEAIYKDYGNHVLIRVQSRRAIALVIQGYCERGPFDLIPRSIIEREVRKRLAGEFGELLVKKTASKSVKPNGSPSPQPKQKTAEATYEQRIREYRKRNPRDAGGARPQVRNRLAEYLAAKSRRVGDGARRSLDGSFTQKTAGARTVWIGLDYGTQNVKIAFRDAETDNQSVILELDPAATGIGRFMISPSTCVVGDQLVHKNEHEDWSPSWKHALSFYFGDSFAVDDSDTRRWLDDCKKQHPAFSSHSPEDLVLFFTSLHISFLLHTAGCKIRNYYRERDIDDDLAFRVFMCAPVAALDQQLSQSVFQDCLTIADEMHAILDFRSSSVSVDDAFQAYEQARSVGLLLEPRLSRRSRVVPEVIAEIASFAQSRAAREGVYALIDIGAGTLDLNVFKIVAATKDEGLSTPVYAATCHPNGVKHLESLLCKAIGNSSDLALELFEEQKGYGQFPDIDQLAEAFDRGQAPNYLGRLNNAHEAYCSDVAKHTHDTWADACRKRGLEKQEWKQLTMFLCGGGAGIRDIQKRLEAGMPRLFINKLIHGVLPCPSEEEFVRPVEFPEEEFHRVAVAYGLTFGSDFEPYIMLPSQVPKVRVYRETIDVESRFISKDMV